MSNLNSQIQAKVEAFVEELSELVRQAALERVSEALGTSSSSAPAKRRGRPPASAAAASTAKSKPAKRAKGAKRSADEMAELQESLLATIEANPGSRADQLAEAFEVETRELALPIKKLLAEGLISKKGNKRATAYYAK